MRLIDADELIEQLEADAEHIDDAICKLMHYALIRDIKHQPTVDPVKRGRWIPCNERLPEIGDAYIVTGIQKDPHEKEWHYFVDVASNYGDYIDEYWDTFNDWIEGQETHIVAWMPLPEPYKIGGDEE